jgi:hypothetical protein
MGTQQILVIVLSVIIVGIGVTLGIKMFENQAYNSNRLAMASEMQQFVKSGVEYWKTPVTMGGAGTYAGNVVLEDIALAMGFQRFRGGIYDGSYGASSENGDYVVVGLENDVLKLKGIGKEMKGRKRPVVLMDLNLNTFICKTSYEDGDSFAK